jgi:spermidine/putrescine transport system substrate-binding protein
MTSFAQKLKGSLTPLLTLSLLILPALTCANENVLRMLVWEGYAPKEYVEAFEQQIEAKYGRKVELQVTYVDGPEDFFAPIRQKSVDLVTLTHHYFKDERFDYIEKGMLLPIEIQNLSNFKTVIPALQKADFLSSNGNIFGVPIGQGPYGLAYSLEKMEQAPKSWKVLWNPEHKGDYILGGNEYLYNVSMAALAWGYPRDKINSFDTLNNKDFKVKLKQLATNAHSFWIGVDTADALAGRSLAAAWGDSLGKLRKRGEAWKMAEPKEGTLSWIDSFAITWALADKPFLKKVAEEWINRLLEPDYQADHIVREVGIVSTTTNIAPRLTAKEKEKLHIGTPDFFKNNRILLPTFSNRDRNGFMLLWKEAMQGRLIEDDVD